MNTRLTTKLWALCLLLPLAACKKQAPVTPASAAAASAVVASATPTGNAASSQINPRFTAEIVAHEEFQRIFAPKLMFRLEPYAGSDSGWSIRIAPVSETAGPAIDCIGAVETPLHGDTKIEIEPPANGSTKDPAWRQREFTYAATEPDCRTAWNLMNDANYATKLSDQEREQASTKLGQIPTRHAKFTIVDGRFGPATLQNPHGTIEWLKFEVDLNAAFVQSLSAASNGAKSSPIRSIDLKSFIESHLGEIDSNLADLATDCGEDQKPLKSLAPILYGDLDGDGQEEVAFEGWSCLSGNGGADFRGVLKLQPDGNLVALPIDTVPKTFKGRKPYADLRGHMVIDIKDGRLQESFGIYRNSDPNCCPSGGERDFVYRWDGHRFVLDDIIDLPPEKDAKGGT